ncbi:MAG: EAL domain-containing protein, partial [Butyrivibrio sp.]|nr:EAL domain-containing protein [Butyrivibrio sp.]
MTEQTYSLDEIMRALANREFVVYYQPQYSALTNRLKSAEALARWRTDHGIVMPGSFIPILEQGEEILEFDWYILREVCRFLSLQEEKKLYRVPVAVNFSRLHFREGDFLPRLLETVDGFGVPHSLVEVEITESAISEDGNEIISQVREIREAGFSVAIDDFGSGLSSLSLVKDMDADVLKIDKSLLSQNCEDEKERIVLESIFSFAHRLKLKTVAEGVETAEQLGFLRTCDCKLIQGFLFSKPLPEEEFLKLCSEGENAKEAEDILTVQAPSAATQLLLDAVFTRYPLVIFSNLTRNSFYMMAYENFTARSCPSTGVFDELIAHGTATMHPD